MSPYRVAADVDCTSKDCERCGAERDVAEKAKRVTDRIRKELIRLHECIDATSDAVGIPRPIHYEDRVEELGRLATLYNRSRVLSLEGEAEYDIETRD